MSKIWFPQQLKTILNRDDLKISLAKTIGYHEIKDILLKSQHVGITTFGEEYPINIICLTAEDGIYVFDLNNLDDKKFLKHQFKNRRLYFYIDNGSYNALLFYKELGIRLYKYPNVIDLTVLDLLIRLNQARTTYTNIIYKSELISEKGPIQLDYEGLVKYNLGADLDLSYSQEDLLSLQSNPENDVSRNLIIKRSSLKRVLGKNLIIKSNEVLDEKHTDLKSFAKRATKDLKISYENQKDGSYAQFCHYLQQCPKLNL